MKGSSPNQVLAGGRCPSCATLQPLRGKANRQAFHRRKNQGKESCHKGKLCQARQPGTHAASRNHKVPERPQGRRQGHWRHGKIREGQRQGSRSHRKLCHHLQRHRNARQLKDSRGGNGNQHACNRRPDEK